MKKIHLLLIIIVFFSNYGIAQINNLVPNGDFEYYTGCPNNLSQIDSAYPWTQPNILGSSSDYLNTCNNYWYTNFFLDYPPRSGNGFASILPSDFYIFPEWREYISNQLKIPLIQNKKYCVKLFVRRFWGNIIIDAFGMLLTNNFVAQSSMAPLLYSPQVKNPRGIMLADTVKWMKIAGSFNALGGEQYITIGNFEPQDSVTRVYLGTDPTWCYYAIDDVSVCDCNDFRISLGNDTTMCIGQQLLLKANVPKEADSVIYNWQDGSKDSTYLVTQPGTYWVSAYIEDYKITVRDTITVNYTDCTATTPQLWIPNSFTPNGDGINDKFEYGNAALYEIKTYIYSRWGQLIFEGANTAYWDGSFKGKPVQMDVYNYKIEAIDKASNEKKVYSGRVTVVK